MSRRDLLSGAVNTVAVSCLLILTATVVRREYFAKPGPGPAQAGAAFDSSEPRPVEDWPQLLTRGHEMGPQDAPVTVLVFSDFECPFCARFANDTYPELQQRFFGRIRLIFRHWPLRMHQWSYPAARAAECAAAQGRFFPFHNLIFAQQHKLGSKTFREFAHEAGVSDLDGFDRCNSNATAVPSIEADISDVKRIGGIGTPTIVINGWLVVGDRSVDAITARIERLLQE